MGDIYGPVSLQTGLVCPLDVKVQRSCSSVTEYGREQWMSFLCVYYKETLYQKKHLDSIAF